MARRVWNTRTHGIEPDGVKPCHPDFGSELSRLVREWRDQRTILSLSQVAVRSGYDKAHLARIEKSGYCVLCGFGVRPSREFLLAWAVVTGCVKEPDYLNRVLEAAGYAPIPGRLAVVRPPTDPNR